MSDFNKLPVFKGVDKAEEYCFHSGGMFLYDGNNPGRNRLKCGDIKLFLFIIFILILQLAGAGTPVPEEMETPVEVQVPLFLKILTFDRNFKERVGDEIVLGIVYQERFRKSLNIKNQIESYLKELPEKTIDDVPLHYISIPLGSLSELKTTLQTKKVDIVYITPLRAVSPESLASISGSLGITSLTGVPRYCEAGVTLSIGSKGGNPLIIINLTAAQSEGADFSSRLLKLARVIKKSKGG